MSLKKIDRINYSGDVYEFVDQPARDDITLLSSRVDRLNGAQSDALADEVQRATDAETALENSKVSKETGKGLSTNDFTDEYKSKIDNPDEMTGATASAAGAKGVVPAPEAGDQTKFLNGAGAWAKPKDTTYTVATQNKNGLMSKEDKTKLDNLDTTQDETSSSQTDFAEDGTITEVLGNGKTKVTSFPEDGSIVQTITNEAGTVITLTTVFNEDGSITRTVS